MKHWAHWCATDPFVSRGIAVVAILGLYAIFFTLYSLEMPPVLP